MTTQPQAGDTQLQPDDSKLKRATRKRAGESKESKTPGAMSRWRRCADLWGGWQPSGL